MAATLKISLLQPLRCSTASAVKPITTQRASPPRAAAPSCSTAAAPPQLATTLYDVLGVPRGASVAEIKASYRRLARLYHPDSRHKDASTEQFLRIHSAYAALADPATRARYDIQLGWVPNLNPNTRPSPASSAWRMRPRTWETDQCW